MKNNETRGAAKHGEERRSIMKNNETRGVAKWWGQVGPILYKSGKLLHEVLAKGCAKEASR